MDFGLEKHANDLSELRHSFHAGVSYTFSINRCSAMGHVASSRDLFPETWMIILYESFLQRSKLLQTAKPK
jgi:hypothetical protein